MRRVLPLLPLLALLGLPLAGSAPAQAAAAWSWPLPGTPEVDRPFEPPASTWGPGHRGVDLGGELHEPVLAAGQGTVTYAGVLAGRGVVTVTHTGGLRTTYEPVDALVAVGEGVEAGDVIGTLGTGHASCRLGTVCLHWGLLRGKTYLDPLTLVVSGHVRLLPLDSHEKHKRKKLKSKKQKETEKRLRARIRSALRKGLKKSGRVLTKGAKAVGRVAGKGGRVLVRKLVPTVGRAAARAAAGAAAAAAAPEVLAGVATVVVVAGAVYYLRRRS